MDAGLYYPRHPKQKPVSAGLSPRPLLCLFPTLPARHSEGKRSSPKTATANSSTLTTDSKQRSIFTNPNPVEDLHRPKNNDLRSDAAADPHSSSIRRTTTPVAGESLAAAAGDDQSIIGETKIIEPETNRPIADTDDR